MNYWKQFAEMFGLELGQEFSIVLSSSKQKSKNVYKITKNGVFSKRSAKDTDDLWGLEQSTTIEHILTGLFEVVPKAWKPKYKKAFWYYSVAWKKAFSDIWFDGLQDLLLWKIGNCFETEEEASTKGKEIMEKLRKEYEEA